MKATTISEAKTLRDIPNVGPAMVADFKTLGIHTPADLQGKDGYELYTRLCTITKTRHDPCVLDTFLAIVDFAHGAPALPWWNYTQQRKQRFPNV